MGLTVPLAILFWTALGGALGIACLGAVERVFRPVWADAPIQLRRPATYVAVGLVLIQLLWIAIWVLWARAVLGVSA